MSARRWPLWPPPGRRALPAAALLLALAAADPRVPLPAPRFEHLAVLDVTQSMGVEDVALQGRPVSRLVLAKAALQDALEALPCGSRLGLGVFTEHRSVLLLAPVEVCAQRPELRDAIERIDHRMAWSGNSEVAKGLNAALRIARELPGTPSLLFVTDGHEAPPLNPRHRPALDAGDAKDAPRPAGWIVGVGGMRPVPIPRSDPQGRPVGTWGADDVLQTDPYSRGRGGSVAGERMVDEPGAGDLPAPDLGATPGREHLSALREPYLQRLADEAGLRYTRLAAEPALAPLLREPSLARRVRRPVALRPALVLAALALLVARHAGEAPRRLRRHLFRTQGNAVSHPEKKG